MRRERFGATLLVRDPKAMGGPSINLFMGVIGIVRMLVPPSTGQDRVYPNRMRAKPDRSRWSPLEHGCAPSAQRARGD